MNNNNINNENPNNGMPFNDLNKPNTLEPNNTNNITINNLTDISESVSAKIPNNIIQENPTAIKHQSVNIVNNSTNEFTNLNQDNTVSNFHYISNGNSNNNTKSLTEGKRSELNNDLSNSQKSIFDIPLINNDHISVSQNKEPSSGQNQVIENINNLSDNETTMSAANQPQNIDFFTFDFSTVSPQTVKEAQNEETTTKTKDDIIQVNFNSVTRTDDIPNTIPKQEENIELTNFLQPRDNIVQHHEEISEANNNDINITNNYTNNNTHNKNRKVEIALYWFYIILALLFIIFLYKIYSDHTDFKLTKDEIILTVNSTYSAEIISNSKIQDNTKYEWSSSDTNIVKVDKNGIITAISHGEAIVTVKKANHEKTLKVKTVDTIIESITFEQEMIKLKVGEEQTLKPIINNDKTIVISLLWESSDENIVAVDQNGHISAKSVGTAIIYVYDDISGLREEIIVEVKPADKVEIPISNISLNKSDATMMVGDTLTVNAVIDPVNATDKTLTWTSNDKSIATVSSVGKITAISAGTTTITATANNGKKASIKIIVTEKVVKVTGISLNKTNVSLEVGETTTLKATVKPSNATNKNINWTSSDETIATVSSSGKVTALKRGTATITATTKDGKKKAVCTITVKEEVIAVTNVSLDKTSLDLEVGDTYILTPIITPSDATITTIEWSSSNTNVATVINGKVIAKEVGDAIITVTVNGNKIATCSVTVKEKVIEVNNITLNQNSITLKVGDSFRLIATIYPSNAVDRTITWTSNNNSYASVSDNGLVTALNEGTVIITARTKNGIEATCTVTIEA